MYRAAALTALERGIEPADGPRVAELVRGMDLHFDWTSDPPELFADGVVVGERIRTPEVTRAVSAVASNPLVRAAMVESQRLIAARHPRLVTEGRDQGSVVFPAAAARFYLDAHPEVRARRRVEQMRSQGRPADYEAVLRAIVERDYLDETRADGPLVCPEGAERVDTSGLTLAGVVQELERRVRAAVDPVHLAPPRAAQHA
jgi:cytidylate kinase